ncbi:hypothetical protein G6O69_13505 [Pseudenhygromyxa sp. WMMC2535]|uniref:hypothetical protein n=1 Tax=Pseudenhygromyxa sp. WMMC2535 TaxID=2712867 RepID=UPI001556E7EE|nr:hypothetical protein [Pseudenhygromyxa sp. WMMC2535]NVB38852.1 hypothetical protein [Pseudenhygromyxa sp. WMMC2535]
MATRFVPTSRISWLASLALVCLVAMASACQHYMVIQQSGPPSALSGAQAVYVQYDYSRIAISDKHMSEQQWLDSREKDEHRQTYLDTKNSVNIGVVEGLSQKLGIPVELGQAPAGGVQLTVTYLDWEEGVYAGVFAWPSRVMAHFIFTIDGQIVDEIEVKTEEEATLFTPAPTQRFHTCGQRLGQYGAEFILKTTK